EGETHLVLLEDSDVFAELVGVLHDLRVEVRRWTDLEQYAALGEPLAQRRVPRRVYAVTDAIRLEVLQHFVDTFPILIFAGVHGDAKPRFTRFLEEGGVIAVAEVRILAPGDVDANDAAVAVRDRLLEDDRVERLVERPVEAEDEPRLHRIFEKGSVEAGDRSHGRVGA